MKKVLTKAIAKIGILLLIWAGLLSGLPVLWPAHLEAATQQYLPLPAGQQAFPYFCATDQPALGDGTDIQQIKPLGVGPVAGGGNIISLIAGFPQFTDRFDIYLGLYAPSIGPELYILGPGGTVEPPDQFVPWVKNAPLLWQPIFGDIPASGVPPGAYYLFLVMTPAGDTTASNYYFWQTSFLVTPPYFSISDSCVNFGSVDAQTTKQVTVRNPGDEAQDILMINGISSSTNDYQITDNTCNASLAAGQTCNFNIVFTPAEAGQVSEGHILISVSRAPSASGPSPTSLQDNFELPIVVTGLQNACSSVQITTNSKEFTTAAGSGSITVNTGAGCPWYAVSDATSWITITSGTSGSGNGQVLYSVAANTGSQRVGHILVGTQTFTVTQDGVANGTCKPTVGAATPASFGPSGGAGTVSVTAPAGCKWQADVSLFYATWLSITSGRQYTGSQTVNFNVAAGTGKVSGSLSVAGKSVAVSRGAGGSGCSYSFSASGQPTTFDSSGGSGGFTITTGQNCPWTIKSSQTSWPTNISPSSGTGNGTVNYTVPASNVTSNATIYVAEAPGTQLILKQNGTDVPTCTYSVSANKTNFSSQADSGTLTITATGTGCGQWSLSNPAWITLSKNSGSGSDSVGFSFSANTATSQRTGTISLDASHKVTITQSGAAPCTITSSSTVSQPIEYRADTGDGAFTGTINVTATGTGCSWTATSTATSWLQITSGSSGTASATVTYTVPANAGSARGGMITVAGKTYVVVQAAAPASWSPAPKPPCAAYIAPDTSKSFVASGGSSSFQFVTTGCSGSWRVTSSDSSWITITGGASGTGDGPQTANYSVAANAGSVERRGSITVGDSSIPQPFSVSQSGASQLQYTDFVLNSSNNFFSNPAAPAGTVAQFFRFQIPAGGCPGNTAQIWLAGLVPNAGNNNMLVSDTDFGTKDHALAVYNALYQNGTGDVGYPAYTIEYPAGSGVHYWHYFTPSGESENIYVPAVVNYKKYYLAVVNDNPVFTQWRLSIWCK